jgi:hypothetical protein
MGTLAKLVLIGLLITVIPKSDSTIAEYLKTIERVMEI